MFIFVSRVEASMSDQTFRSQRAASPTNSVDRQLRTSAQHIVHKVISNARESLRYL